MQAEVEFDSLEQSVCKQRWSLTALNWVRACNELGVCMQDKIGCVVIGVASNLKVQCCCIDWLKFASPPAHRLLQSRSPAAKGVVPGAAIRRLKTVS